MDTIAEQAHGRGGKLLPQERGGAAGFGGADFQDRAPHQLLDFLGRAAGQQPSLVDQGQAIAALGLVEIGRGDKDRHFLAQQLVKDPPEVAARDRIDAVGRLVQEQHSRRVDQRAGQAEFLLHAAGEVSRQAAFEGREIAEGQQPPDTLVAALAGHVVNVGVEVEVFHHGQVGIEPEALAHVADFRFDGLGLADDVMPGHPGLAAVGRHDRRKQAHGGRLAGAVGTDKAENLTLLDGQGEAVESSNRIECLGETLGTDHFKTHKMRKTKQKSVLFSGMKLSTPARLPGG